MARLSDARAAAGAHKTSEPAEHEGVACRVLVVDDSQDGADTLARLLRMEGHDVRAAADGPSALAAAAAFRPDVVLLDIGLPRMDGYEVAAQLRQLPEVRSALLVALTGYGQNRDGARAPGGL
jgi:CheY-like chemotaxis protein